MKNFLIGLLIFFIVILISVIGILTYAAAKIISEEMITSSQTSLDYSAWFSANKKLNEEVKAITRKENIDNIRAVDFTKSEVNSLLFMGVNAGNAYKNNSSDNEEYRIINASFDGGKFIVDIAVKLKRKILFGQYINVHIEFVPNVNNSMLQLHIDKLYLGEIGVPVSVLNYFIKTNSVQINENPNIKIITYIIKEFKIENDEILIEYIPASALNVIPL